MKTIKIKLKNDQADALWNYIEHCANECRQSDQLSDFIRLAYWIVNDLRNQINKKVRVPRKTYTINFKPHEAYVFLALKGKSWDPYEKNVIRQIRADLDKAK